jgi:hypothetical protein
MDTIQKRGRPSSGLTVKLQVRVTPDMAEQLARVAPDLRDALTILLAEHFASKINPELDSILRRTPPAFWQSRADDH